MKTTSWMIAVVLLTGSVGAQVPGCTLPLPSGLVAWWRAESNAVDSVSQIGAAYSGNQPGYARFTNGLVDAAFRIGVRSYFIVEQRPALDVGATNGFTIEGWINPDGLTHAQSFAEWNDGKNIGVGLMIRTNVLEGYLTGTAKQTFRSVVVQSAAGLLRSGAWQHVAMTYDRGSGLAKIFLNGASVAQTNLGEFRAATQAPLYLGFRRAGPFSGGYYSGGLDEFSVYNRALSGVEIFLLHNAGSAGKCYATCQHPGLVSWWRGERDQSVGENVVLDSWDSNNGTSPYAMRYATGKVSQAFNLLQNYVHVPDSASMRFTNALTLEAWVRPTSVSPALQTILSKFDYEIYTVPWSLTRSAYYLGITNGGRVVFKVSTNGSPRTNTTLLSVRRIATNQWTHVAATFGSGIMRLFINGQEDTKTNLTGGVFPGNADLGIGAQPYGTGFGPIQPVYPFGGLLDEVAIYNRQLSEFEVQAIYNADTAGKCLAPPSIAAQPQDQVIPLGEDAKFSVSILGSRPLRYQWRFNGQNLPGATNATLLLEKVQSNRIGNYTVFVTNALGSVLSGNAALTLLPAPTCTATPEGLISWWPGDGNGADAMATNNFSYPPSAYATGKVDRAFSFLGNATYRATVLNSPSLNFNSNANFSIELWIKAGASNTTYANVPLFEKHPPVFDILPIPQAWVGYSLSLNQGRLAFALGSSTGRTTVVSDYISPGPDLRDAMFHHVAVSVNREATNGGTLFVDGQPVLTFDPTPRNGNLTTTSPLYVGGPTTTVSDSYFGGLIDEPAIYNRALSASEILAIRNAGAAGRCKVRPLIITQPVSQRVTIGSNATFMVVADGTPKLRYQWLKSGQAIPSATNSTCSFVVGDGKATYSVRVTNLFGIVISSNASLTVNHVPFFFDLLPPSRALFEDTSISISLTAGDTDGDPLTFRIAAPPTNGTLANISSRPIYTPNANYHGPDSFSVTVNDGLVDSAAATVTLNILPVNDAPVAASQAVSLDEDTAAAITLAGFDVDGDVLAFNFNAPAHGTLSGVPPNLMYQPATNYFGSDSFTFNASDGKTNSSAATVSLTVRPVNDAPLANFVVSPLLTNVPGVTNWVLLAAVCGGAQAVFDGAGSSDVEDDRLSFTWLDHTNVFATGELVTNSLAPGSHEISLQVSDGQTMGVTTATVEVISPAQGVGIVIVLLHESELGRRNVQPLIASLKNAAAAFERCDPKPGVNQLEAFKQKVRAQVEPLNRELAAKLIEAVDQVLGAVR